jgi:hypothetical protein
MSRLFSSQSFFSPRGCLVRILILVFRILGEYCNCVYMNCWLCDPCRTATWWMMLSLSRNVPCPFRWQGWNCIVLPTTTKKRAIHDKRYGKMKISPDIFQPQFMVVFDLWMSDFSSSWNVNDVGTGIISDSSWLVFPKNYLCILFKTQILHCKFTISSQISSWVIKCKPQMGHVPYVELVCQTFVFDSHN